MASPVDILRSVVSRRGVAPVARVLGMHRQTITSILAGTATDASLDRLAMVLDRLGPQATLVNQLASRSRGRGMAISYR